MLDKNKADLYHFGTLILIHTATIGIAPDNFFSKETKPMSNVLKLQILAGSGVDLDNYDTPIASTFSVTCGVGNENEVNNLFQME